MFSAKKREKEEGSFKGLSTGYDIFIFLFIASMLCFAVRRTLDGTYKKILSLKNHISTIHTFVHCSSFQLNNPIFLLLMQMLAVLRNESRSFQLPSIFNTEQEVWWI